MYTLKQREIDHHCTECTDIADKWLDFKDFVDNVVDLGKIRSDFNVSAVTRSQKRDLFSQIGWTVTLILNLKNSTENSDLWFDKNIQLFLCSWTRFKISDFSLQIFAVSVFCPPV